MIRLALILLGLAVPAAADPARVYSGEHGDFTRLVVELPAASEWLLGRTDDGYAFATHDAVQPDYDTAEVWKRITRARAAAINTDPETGALRLSLGCDCHVIPFEYRPGVVVLDIRSGKAPPASEFETRFEDIWQNRALPDPRPMTGSRKGYDWLERRETQAVPDQTSPRLPFPLATGGVSLEPLRDALLEQLARGAADGIVDLGLPMTAGRGSGARSATLPWSDIRIGEQPGIEARLPSDFDESPRPTSTCPDETQIDLAAWAETGTPTDMLASARSGLYGEFDIADPEAVLRSVRLHLYLGFGAEAVQIADLAAGSEDADLLALYRSLGRLIDGEADAEGPWTGMLDCDGPAALWAALARDSLPRGPGVNRAAILRTFQALPPHLRRHLGPGLADRFLAIDDPEAARIVRDAMSRAPNAEPGRLALLDASSSLHLGDVEAALRHSEDAVALNHNDAESLLVLVESHFQDLRPLATDISEALLAWRGETGDADLAAKIDRAIVLSQALSGQFDAAFGDRDLDDKALADLWKVAARRADDDAFLRHALPADDRRPPALNPELSLTIANRLLDLGFADAALVWIGPVSTSDTEVRRRTAAQAELGVGDARSALRLLEGLNDADSRSIRASALLQIGDLNAAEMEFRAVGDPETADRVDLWQGEAPAADADLAEVWTNPALWPATAAPEADSGLLGRAASRLDESAAARAAVEALLHAVPRPSDP